MFVKLVLDSPLPLHLILNLCLFLETRKVLYKHRTFIYSYFLEPFMSKITHNLVSWYKESGKRAGGPCCAVGLWSYIGGNDEWRLAGASHALTPQWKLLSCQWRVWIVHISMHIFCGHCTEISSPVLISNRRFPSMLEHDTWAFCL